jgi:hypothetical protein
MDGNALIKKLWHWFDEYFLLAATAFLIAFIPLYPKIPLADLIPGYIVRLRLEDIFIAIVGLWWGIQLLRRKVTWKTPLSWFILAYIFVGLISNIAGVWITRTIPLQTLHIGKSMLHWMRHIQYFSLFFIAYNAVKNRRQGMFLIGVVLATLLGVVIYGYGQKYLYWPVYSTMNREFSKGMRLYLSEHARVQSTFAGHYDLGGYLVVILPITLAIFFSLERIKKILRSQRLVLLTRFVVFLTWLGGLWLLVMSAARTSYIAYVLAAGIVVGLYMLKRGIIWGISRGMTVLLISVVMMLVVGDLSSRFTQLIDENQYPWLTSAMTTIKDVREQPFKLIGFNPKPPSDGKSTAELEAELAKSGMTVSDTQPSSSKPKDVYGNIPEKEFDLNDPAATLSANVKQVGDKLVQERTFSDCALKYSLSVCIRLETLWPQAFAGFMRNPVVGSGYATLTKATVEQFTEAESTDNNFLRTLGENGAAGFFFFYGSMGLALWYSWLAYRRSKNLWITALAVANFAATIGLLVNAMYIDVFVASKVAYTFWLLQGIFLAVFVKEGLVAPQYAFARKAESEDTSRLRELLQKSDQAAQAKVAHTQYLSPSKRRQKSSTRKMKQVRKN